MFENGTVVQIIVNPHRLLSWDGPYHDRRNIGPYVNVYRVGVLVLRT